eukprot:1154788-Pelagomonas_calceolata.AAC.2
MALASSLLSRAVSGRFCFIVTPHTEARTLSDLTLPFLEKTLEGTKPRQSLRRACNYASERRRRSTKNLLFKVLSGQKDVKRH